MHIYVRIFYGCFHAIMAELNSGKRDHMACKFANIYYLVLERNSFLTPDTIDKATRMLKSLTLIISFNLYCNCIHVCIEVPLSISFINKETESQRAQSWQRIEPELKPGQ